MKRRASFGNSERHKRDAGDVWRSARQIEVSSSSSKHFSFTDLLDQSQAELTPTRISLNNSLPTSPSVSGGASPYISIGSSLTGDQSTNNFFGGERRFYKDSNISSSSSSLDGPFYYNDSEDNSLSPSELNKIDSNPFASFFSANFGGVHTTEGMDIDIEELIGGLGHKNMGGQFGRPSNFGNYGGVPSKQAKVQDTTIEKEIPVSLEEIAKGAEKKMKISRKVHQDDGRVTTEDKVLKITVKPGWKSGTKVTFSQEGDKFPGRTPADIAFIIRDKPHPVFSRDGTNLKYTYKIPLREALCGSVVQVPTLEGKKVGINCSEVIKPTTTKRLQGYGLPFPKEPNRRGDLIVSFEVLFPDNISTTSKRTLYEALS